MKYIICFVLVLFFVSCETEEPSPPEGYEKCEICNGVGRIDKCNSAEHYYLNRGCDVCSGSGIRMVYDSELLMYKHSFCYACNGTGKGQGYCDVCCNTGYMHVCKECSGMGYVPKKKQWYEL